MELVVTTRRRRLLFGLIGLLSLAAVLNVSFPLWYRYAGQVSYASATEMFSGRGDSSSSGGTRIKTPMRNVAAIARRSSSVSAPYDIASNTIELDDEAKARMIEGLEDWEAANPAPYDDNDVDVEPGPQQSSNHRDEEGDLLIVEEHVSVADGGEEVLLPSKAQEEEVASSSPTKEGGLSALSHEWKNKLNALTKGNTLGKVKIKKHPPTSACDRKATSNKNEESFTGYLISLDYDQQMMGFFRAFYHLAVFANFFNLSIVEPYVYGKGRLGVPIVRETSRPVFLKLTNFFDFCQLKRSLKMCNRSKFASFEEFANFASPDFVFVSFLPSLKGYETYFSGGSKIVEISNLTEKLNTSLGILNKWIKWFSLQDTAEMVDPVVFKWSRIILIDARPLHSISLEDIKQALSLVVRQQVEKFGTVTLVLDNWRDIGKHSSFFYAVRGFNNVTCPQIFTTRHSQNVMKTSRQFTESLDLVHPVIGIHVRGERLLIDSAGNPSYYTHCLSQLRELVESGSLVSETEKGGSVVLFHDLGKYGSQSCHHYPDCVTEKENFLVQIKELGYRIASYDPSRFRPVYLQSVFAAFVEKEFLSNVDVLLTVGLGNFQQNIVDRFLRGKNGSGSSLHRVCFSPHRHHSNRRSNINLSSAPQQ